jgi:uncharacterized membrane protein YsdA (DUF1294 family)
MRDLRKFLFFKKIIGGTDTVHLGVQNFSHKSKHTTFFNF